MDSWLSVWISSSSTCSGVLPSSRDSCVSVAILVGMRFRTRICSGRMSCVTARVSFMTKIFSSASVFAAGRPFGIIMGMAWIPF